MKTTYLIYALEVLAVLTFIFSVQFKKKKDILLCQTVSSVLYALSYLFIGGYSGAGTEIFEQIKNIIFYNYEKKNKKIPLILLIIFCLGIVLIGVFTYTGFNTLAPLAINIAYFVSSYFKNPKHIRWTVFLCGFAWIYYNFTIGAYIFCIGNCFEVISGGISIWRYRYEDNKRKRPSRKKVKVHKHSCGNRKRGRS